MSKISRVAPGRGLDLNYNPCGTKFFERYKKGSELDHIGFWVEAVEKTCKTLLRKGAEAIVNPFTVGKFKLAFTKDPDRDWIELGGVSKEGKTSQRGKSVLDVRLEVSTCLGGHIDAH